MKTYTLNLEPQEAADVINALSRHAADGRLYAEMKSMPINTRKIHARESRTCQAARDKLLDQIEIFKAFTV